MRQREYQFIFFLNIRHSFYSETELGRKHSHTWELEVSMHPVYNELVQFREAEQVIQDYLERFQDKYLNEMPPFDRLNPSIENFLDYVAGDIDRSMREKDWEVKELRISENPTRGYAIDRMRMDELAESADAMLRSDVREGMPETAATAEGEAANGAVGTDKTEYPDGMITAEGMETGADEESTTNINEPEPQIVTNYLINSKELKVKTQTGNNMSRVVVTVL